MYAAFSRLYRGTVDQVDPAQAAGALESILHQLADPDNELTGPPRMVARLEGAAMALRMLAQEQASKKASKRRKPPV